MSSQFPEQSVAKLSKASAAQLQQLRPGYCLKYHGVQWQVKDYDTYTDPKGYETAEWLLESKTGIKYYLLREIDPQNPESLLNWYIAEEIRNPKIFQPGSSENLVPHLWQDMQRQQTPYPTLQLFHRLYEFESSTQGSYEGNQEETSRITWDYWDAAHQWNLAIEAWPTQGELHVYSTKVVKPEELSEIQKGRLQNLSGDFVGEVIVASAMMIIGIFMMMFG